jgi:surface protein
VLKFNAGLAVTSTVSTNLNYFRIQINVASNLLTWSASVNMASTQTITVFWGDSTSTNYTSSGAVQFNITHTYSAAGLYDITVKCNGFQLGRVTQNSNQFTDRNITRIYDWGVPQSNSISMHYTMQYQPQLTNVPNYLPASNISNCEDLLSGCASLNDANISSWNVSTVTRMTGMFAGCTQFNRSLANWDVSKVINMQYMFLNALTFNQDISGWDVHLIATEPSQFDQGCNNWIEAYKPVWGTTGSH